MRKFLLDYEKIVTMDEVRKCYEDFCDYKDESSFEDYLFDALGRNGSLDEILTADTPKAFRREALCLCAVVDSSADIETMHDDVRWLNWYSILNLQDYGYHVVPTNLENWA